MSLSSQHRRSVLFRYGFAVVAPIVAALLTVLLWRWLRPAVSLMFFPAVLLTAMYGGLRAGMVSTALSVVFAATLFRPAGSQALGFDDFFRLVIFAISAVITASLSAARERAEARQRQDNQALQQALSELQTLSADLERRVEARTHDLEASNSALQVEIGERRRLSERLVQVQESERRWLACELHDHVGQHLTALRLMLDTGARQPVVTPERAAEARLILDDLIAQIRELSLDLRPSMLDDLGLAPTLLWHVDRFSTQTGIRVQMTRHGGDRRVVPELETAAFRIVQEALTNIARHAGVNEAGVWVRQDDTELCVIVEDAGRGFSPDSIELARSTGLSGMRERVTLLGGQFTVTSAPAGGTRITAVFPLAGVAG